VDPLQEFTIFRPPNMDATSEKLMIKGWWHRFNDDDMDHSHFLDAKVVCVR